MYSIDINKVITLQEDHWNWFWNRAEEKTIEFTIKNYGSYKCNCVKFWRLFWGWRQNDVKKIVYSPKEEMLKLIDENGAFYKTYLKNFSWFESFAFPDCNEKNLHNEVVKLIQVSFGYGNFEGSNYQENENSPENKCKPNLRVKRKLWNAYTFTRKLGVDVCPYCGRQYTFTLGSGEKNNKFGRPQIDHYFPEAEYPFLSCSLLNFIPSCSSCNHQKSDTYNNSTKGEPKYIPYPYEDFVNLSKNNEKKLYDDVKFKAFYQFVKDEDGKNTNELCYSIKLQENGNPLASEELKNANSAFHLEDLYNMHELELDDLFTRYRIYNKSRLKNVLSLIHSARNSFNADFPGNKAFFKGIVTAESCRLKNVILGFPLGGRDRQYPLKKFKGDIVAQLDETSKKMKKR